MISGGILPLAINCYERSTLFLVLIDRDTDNTRKLSVIGRSKLRLTLNRPFSLTNPP
jgi:hypothetical protein